MEFREELRARGYHFDIGDLETLVLMVRERVSFAKDIWNETDFFFKAPESYDSEVIKKRWKEDTPLLLSELRNLLDSLEDLSPEPTENTVKSWIAEKGYNTGSIMNALRLVIVGASRGPHIFEITGWIGKEETIRRIDRGLAVIGK